MKQIILVLAALLIAGSIFAQTAEEIVGRMEAEMEKHEQEGIVMTIDAKLPVVGTMTTQTYTLGDKMRVEGKMVGIAVITWSDGQTQWTYNSKTNTVEIEREKGEKDASDGDAEMFLGLTDDYDVSIEKETADAWYIRCKKSKTNTDKDAPKTIDLVVAKKTFYPVSLKTKISGVAITLREISFGVTESKVTFNPQDYPGVKIEDKR